MELDHDVHAVADRRADLAERLQAFLQVRPRDVLPVARFGERIERPDLHAGDSLLEERLRQLVGVVQERVEVFIRSLRFPVEAPVLRALSAGAAHIAVTGAGVVGAHSSAAGAAENLVQGLVAHLAVQVPEREIERRGGAGFDPGAAPAEIAGEAARQRLDLEGVAAEDAWCHIFVHVGLDALRRIAGFAQPGDALIGVHAQPDEIRELGEAQRFQSDDLHITFASL